MTRQEGNEPMEQNAAVPHGGESNQPLHQLSEARRRQGLSMRCVAKRLQTTIAEVRLQEEAHQDLKLSDLYRWQEALGVPLDELLYEPDEALSPRILDRARMLRVMKTAQALRTQARSPGLKRLAETLVEQLLDLMPELKTVSPWPSVGQRRTSEEMGRIVENPIPENWFRESK